MKTAAILFTFFLLSSCVSEYTLLRTEKEIVSTAYIDLSKYAEKGFYFSPNDINQTYVVLGEILIEQKFETDIYIDEVSMQRGNSQFYVDSVPYMRFDYKPKPVDSLFEKAYNICAQKKGNGLINYKLTVAADRQTLSGTLINW